MKVLAMDKTAEEGLKIIRDAGIEVDSKAGLTEDELVKIIPEYDALIVRSETKVTPKIIEAGKNLKIMARAGVGVDNIDLPTATKNGRYRRQFARRQHGRRRRTYLGDAPFNGPLDPAGPCQIEIRRLGQEVVQRG